MDEITPDMFRDGVGRYPNARYGDSLDRCNCKDAGKPGHTQCGWCYVHNKPRYNCRCFVEPVLEKCIAVVKE